MGVESRDSYELFWVRHQPYLLQRGDLLRPRYDPNWTPSWHLPDAHSRDPWDYEDSYVPAVVFASDDNGTVPLIEVITVPSELGNKPGEALIVMPKLIDFHRLGFHCRSEVAHLMRSVLEAAAFMHTSVNITHGDLVMMDPTDVCPGGYHFASLRGSDAFQPLVIFQDVKYRIRSTTLLTSKVPFGFPAGRASATIETNVQSQWKCAAEINQTSEQYIGLDDFQSLLERMTAEDVSMRPSAEEALDEMRASEAAMGSEPSKELLEWTFHIPLHLVPKSQITFVFAYMRNSTW
ncbi:hypothetical protein BDZ89DRAFT_1209805 [Hymenopellis radicata]|nr:hypothetical protein BDZ89DRAFT_1209805 [Hymenopellis radicata]